MALTTRHTGPLAPFLELEVKTVTPVTLAIWEPTFVFNFKTPPDGNNLDRSLGNAKFYLSKPFIFILPAKIRLLLDLILSLMFFVVNF
jgi:hypothetical protein